MRVFGWRVDRVGHLVVGFGEMVGKREGLVVDGTLYEGGGKIIHGPQV